MSIAVTCVCHNNFAAEVDEGELTVSCPVCAAEMRVAPAEDRPIELPADTRSQMELGTETVDGPVLPDGDLALRIEPRDAIIEVEVETVDEEEDDGRASYAFLPEPANFADDPPRPTGTPGFWGEIGFIRLKALATCLAYGPNSRWALVGQRRDIRIVNMFGGVKPGVFRGHATAVSSAAVAKETGLALSGDETGNLLCWDVATRRVVHHRQAHAGPILALAVSPRGDYAATGGADGITRLWDLVAACRERPLARIRRPEETTGITICPERLPAQTDEPAEVTAVAFSDDGNLLLAGGAGRVDVWSVENGRHVRACSGAAGPIWSIFGGNGSVMAAAAPIDFDVIDHPKLWNWRTGPGMAPSVSDPWAEPTTIPGCAAFDANGKRLVVAGRYPAFGVSRFLPSMPGRSALAYAAEDVRDAFRSFFSFIEVPGSEPIRKIRYSLEVWSLATGKRLHAFPQVRGEIERLAVSPDNTRILAALAEGGLQVFSMPGV